MEKTRTVPDSYPMSLNGLVTGCNQKTSRDPVMQLTDAELRKRRWIRWKLLTLVFESSGNRTTRWEHNFQRGVVKTRPVRRAAGPADAARAADGGRAAHQRRALAPVCRHLVGGSVFG